jgi:hypothetical protein
MDAHGAVASAVALFCNARSSWPSRPATGRGGWRQRMSLYRCATKRPVQLFRFWSIAQPGCGC